MILEEETYKKFGYYSSDLTQWSKKKILVTCDDCGKIREIRQDCYRALCISCAQKGKQRSQETREKMSDAKRGERVKRKCQTCGTPFEVTHIIIKEGKGKFCSLSCSYQGKTNYWLGKMGKDASRWNGGPAKCKCRECGRIFYRAQWIVKSGGSIFCSRACAGKSKRGANSSSWRGGLSFGKYCHKFNNMFKEYIRDKFNRKCFLCGKTEEKNGQRLSVHHVNYDKQCGCADTEEGKKADNKSCQFVPLCRSCNSKVNKDRAKWESYFKNTLRNKLNGWYI